MKRREFLEAALTLLSAPAVASCFPAALDAVLTDYINRKIEQKEEQEKEKIRKNILGIRESVVTLKTVASFFAETDRGRFQTRLPIIGKGLIYGDYILTVNRVTSIDETALKEDFSENGMEIVKVEVLSKKIYADRQPLEQIVANSENEIAILKIPNGYKKPDYKIKLGNGGELRAIDKIFTLVNVDGDKTIIKEGIVRNDGLIGYLGLNNFKFNGKAASFSINPYEIGSPVINKNGEIVGLISNANAFSSIFEDIQGYKKEIEKYENKKKS